MTRCRTARVARLLGIAVALVLLLAGCSADSAAQEPTAPPARPVTTEEAQLLAVVRFNNFDTGTRPFSTAITEKGTELELEGWIDYAGHLGYAQVTGSFTPQALLWNGTTVGVHDSAPDANGNPALPIKDPTSTDWITHPLDGSTAAGTEQRILDAAHAVFSAAAPPAPACRRSPPRPASTRRCCTTTSAARSGCREAVVPARRASSSCPRSSR